MTGLGLSARRRIALCLLPGALAAMVVGSLSKQWGIAALAGWDVTGAAFVAWTWHAVWRLDGEQTREDAEREDPTRPVTDALVLVAALASLGGVAMVLLTRSSGGGPAQFAVVGLAVASLAASWSVVHTVFAVTYTRLYYGGPDGGVDFPGDGPPTYADFAYLAFTVGMTFQVSDTPITSREIRRTVLRQALLAYLFGSVILAAMVNLVAGLG